MSLLYAAGARAAEPGEFTQRSFLNGKMDLAQAEAVADVIASQNAAAHRIAFKQMKGGFSSELRDMRGELLELVSLMELELDFSEEEVEFADRSRLDSLLEKIIAHVSRLIDSFRLGNAIKNGVPVAIAGATNTGKSTLLNALLGEDRAIVSDIHGTTRDTIEETLNIDGILFRFIDTAGIRETSETVEKIGIERTFKKISEASIVLGMIDLTRDFESTCETIRSIVETVDFDTQKLVFLLNKTDISEINKNVSIENYIVSLLNNKEITINSYNSGSERSISGPEGVSILQISAKTGSGLSDLRTILAQSQHDLLADSDTTLVTNQRHAQALSEARTSLLRVREGLASGLPTDLAAQDIREAIYHLGSIVGEISTDEVLGNIFRNFCIGK
jgi:tRNA modification GTPase